MSSRSEPRIAVKGGHGSYAALGSSREHVRYSHGSGLELVNDPGRLSAMCGRLPVGKENLHVAEIGRCGHVFGLLRGSHDRWP